MQISKHRGIFILRLLDLKLSFLWSDYLINKGIVSVNAIHITAVLIVVHI
jgi:hypothetical protein